IAVGRLQQAVTKNRPPFYTHRAVSACRRPTEHDVIAGPNFGDAGADFSYDAGSFMSEHDRGFRRPVAACGMQIAVAHAGCFYFDEYFAGMGRFKLTLLVYGRFSL